MNQKILINWKSHIWVALRVTSNILLVLWKNNSWPTAKIRGRSYEDKQDW